jgi:predicted DNA-binding mobile mystery protein A
MSPKQDTLSLARKHLDRRLAPLRKSDDLQRPPRGWIRAIREALGLSTTQLGKRLGVTQSRIPRIEQGEVADTLTLKTLRSVAEAMDCTLVYAIVPNRPLDDVLRHRAEEVADRQLGWSNQTMTLENQALGRREQQTERERLISELLRNDIRRLWETR